MHCTHTAAWPLENSRQHTFLCAHGAALVHRITALAAGREGATADAPWSGPATQSQCACYADNSAPCHQRLCAPLCRAIRDFVPHCAVPSETPCHTAPCHEARSCCAVQEPPAEDAIDVRITVTGLSDRVHAAASHCSCGSLPLFMRQPPTVLKAHQLAFMRQPRVHAAASHCSESTPTQGSPASPVV